MKTQKEIEELAAREYWRNNVEIRSFIKGYTQCQEDMADKRYTEDDIKEAAYFFVSKKLAANQGILDEEIQDFINSLNKQD
jgi:hypothetical protein